MQTRKAGMVVTTALTLAFGGCNAPPEADRAAVDKEAAMAPEQQPFGYLAPDVLARMVAQEPLRAAASRIHWAVETGSEEGFTGLQLADQRVVLYWKGELSSAMRRVLDEAGQLAPIEVHSAPYALVELRQAAEQIAVAMRAADSAIDAVEIPVDGSGVIVNSEHSRYGALPLMPEVGVPVSLSQHEQLHFSSRLADTPPYYGGARIVNQDNGAQCSSGFGVVKGSSKYLLTAGHCGRPGGGWWNGNRSRTIGSGSLENVGHDLLLIGADAGNRIFDGGVGTGEFSKGVAGWDWVHAGESLCVSPSFSGVICGATVTNNFTYSYCDNDVYGHRECYNDLLIANNGSRGIQHGDSGGPAFSLASNSRVTAKGTISGFNSSSFAFQDFGTAWRDFGITPLTSP